jgi:dTDP-4-dehydrorhamnose reductase
MTASGPRILVLGGTGMLGHKMVQVLSRRFDDVTCTVRGSSNEPAARRLHEFAGAVIDGVDVMDTVAVQHLIRDRAPDVVVNCVGSIKQRDEASNAVRSITINSLLPHAVAAAVSEYGGRVIHFSTDCVFSGHRGDYSELDPSDAEDLYGKSKYLGEVGGSRALTLRTSIIGRELQHHASLLDWFLAQRGTTIRGFQRAWWSGVSTLHLSEVVARIITDWPALSGVYQLSSGRISKYDLLILLRDAYDLNVNIVPDDTLFCDRSLKGDRLREAIGYVAPPWSELAAELVADPTPYALGSPA